jgi:excisionase family DNA binding protein
MGGGAGGLLTLREAAERLRVSEWTLRRLVKDGTVRPCRLTPGKLLFTSAELDRAVREASGGAPDAPAAAGAG